MRIEKLLSHAEMKKWMEETFHQYAAESKLGISLEVNFLGHTRIKFRGKVFMSCLVTDGAIRYYNGMLDGSMPLPNENELK